MMPDAPTRNRTTQRLRRMKQLALSKAECRVASLRLERDLSDAEIAKAIGSTEPRVRDLWQSFLVKESRHQAEKVQVRELRVNDPERRKCVANRLGQRRRRQRERAKTKFLKANRPNTEASESSGGQAACPAGEARD